MTYGEARALVTILMVSRGEPAPDFSDDSKYQIGMHTNSMDPTKREMLFRLSINNRARSKKDREYDELPLTSGARLALNAYLQRLQRQPGFDTTSASPYTTPVASQDDAPTEG